MSADLEALEAEREALWAEYDRVARGIPECEHVRAWRQETAKARAAHHAAIRAVDRAKAEAEAAEAEPPGPPPVLPSLPAEPGPSDDGALFPLEMVA